MQFLSPTVKVLLVENNVADFELIEQYFAQNYPHEYQLAWVELLQDGIAYLQQNSLDVILLDLNLPDSQGLKSLSAMQKIAAEVPIVVITGMDEEEIALESLNEGAQDYLIKEKISPKLFQKTITCALECHQNSTNNSNSEDTSYFVLANQTIPDKCDLCQNIFKTIVDTIPALIWMTDARGNCTFFNQTWLNFTGYSLNRQLSEGWLALVHPSEKTKCQKIYQLALKNQAGFSIEHRLLRFDGTYRWMYTTAVRRSNTDAQFVGLIGSCIDITPRKQAEEKLEQQAESNRIVAQITKTIHSSLDLDYVLKTTVAEISQFLQAEKISIIKKVAGKDNFKILLESVSTSSDNEPSCNLDLAQKQSIIQIPDNLTRLTAGEVVAINNQQSSESCHGLLAPIVVENKLWGVLSVEPYSVLERWHFDVIELLNQVAVQLAIAIQQAELYQQLTIANQELEELSTVDPLTNIANRRKFDRYLAQEWQRLAREKAPLSLIMCDIDYFKLYNDTYGHQAGDRCLKLVAQAIAKTIKRPADLVARYGGEEFAVILPNTTVGGAVHLAQQMRLQISSLQIPHINSPLDLYITLSLGVAGFVPTHDTTVKTLIAAADKSLYRAKKLGRDRVVQYSPTNE